MRLTSLKWVKNYVEGEGIPHFDMYIVQAQLNLDSTLLHMRYVVNFNVARGYIFFDCLEIGEMEPNSSGSSSYFLVLLSPSPLTSGEAGTSTSNLCIFLSTFSPSCPLASTPSVSLQSSWGTTICSSLSLDTNGGPRDCWPVINSMARKLSLVTIFLIVSVDRIISYANNTFTNYATTII